MRTTSVKLYNIKELKPDSRAVAVEYLRTNDYFGAGEHEITNAFKETLKEYGLPTETVEWSLGWCQGDGVAFYGDIDIKKLLVKTGKYD